MNKKAAIFIALLISIIVLGNWIFFNASNIFSEREIVVISRVIDGDTIELEDGRTIRLLNINTPEKNEFGADLARVYLNNFVDKSVELEYAGIEKYGRVLGRVYSKEYLNLEIVRLGFGHPFLVDEKEISDFANAKEEAVNNEAGIWQRSEHYGCLDVKIEEKEEYVIIKDSCGMNFENWILKDESTKKYKFTSFSSNKFTLYSGEGTDNANELYWEKGDVWNNDRDSIFIRDSEGLLVYSDSYGY